MHSHFTLFSVVFCGQLQCCVPPKFQANSEPNRISSTQNQKLKGLGGGEEGRKKRCLSSVTLHGYVTIRSRVGFLLNLMIREIVKYIKITSDQVFFLNFLMAFKSTTITDILSLLPLWRASRER